MFERLKRWFEKRKSGEIAEDLCPNCWGEQEYDGEVIDLVKDHQKDVNRGTDVDAFVRAFQVRYVDGIHEKGHGEVGAFHCARCSKYFEVSEQRH